MTFGYRKKQNLIGQFEYEYLIYEHPDTQKGDMDLGELEKGIQININNKIDNDDKTEISSFLLQKNITFLLWN